MENGDRKITKTKRQKNPHQSDFSHVDKFNHFCTVSTVSTNPAVDSFDAKRQ